VLPLAHVYSLNGTLGAVVRQGATAVLVNGFDVRATLQLVQQHRVTNIPGAPSMWTAWSEFPSLGEKLTGVRRLFNGSDALSPEVQRRVQEATGLDVHEGYGLTEASPGVSSTLVSGVVKPGSVGRPFPGVETRLVGDDGADVDHEEHDPGEIWIRGDNLFSGYWPDGQGGPDSDGWYATGDIAFADDDGDLHLVDRSKDIIIVNGFNVYPREVEEALLQHPSVVEAAVVGAPDEQTGERVTAYVVAASAAVVEEEVGVFVAERLARFKRPSTVEVVAELPHSLTGKVRKADLGSDG
jgi:long-chain acyl-CoA synthetase